MELITSKRHIYIYTELITSVTIMQMTIDTKDVIKIDSPLKIVPRMSNNK